jgi:hypothetical protein
MKGPKLDVTPMIWKIGGMGRFILVGFSQIACAKATEARFGGYQQL